MATEDLACIDEEISEQVLILCNLRTRRNRLAPTSRLPAETLATIFIQCARDHHYDDRWHFTSTVLGWVNLSYVCRYWRDVALSCPTLWSYISPTSQRWTEELLARSKQASLKLRVKWAYQDDTPFGVRFLGQVMNRVERVQELHLHFPATDTHEILSKLPSHAPCLQNLKISSNIASLNWSSVLFNGGTPALRTLELLSCPTPWYSFELSGLTTLSLRDVDRRFQQDTTEFLASLSSMQGLKYLYLNDALASAAGFLSKTEFNTFKRIDLPHLSRLLIIAPLSTVIVLLSCVNIPLKTEVKLSCASRTDPSPVDCTLLSSALAQRFNVSEDESLASPIIRSLTIDSTTWGVTKLTFSGLERDCNSFSVLDTDWGCNIPLRLIIDLDLSMLMDDGDGDDPISDVCCSIPLPDVQSLHVISPMFPPSFWRKTFGHLQDLRYLKLSHGNMPNLASALSLSAVEDEENWHGHAPSARDQKHILTPKLEELELSRLTFPPEDTDMSALVFARRHLFGALSNRNMPQGRLTMTQCDISGFELLDTVCLWGDLAQRSDFFEGDFDHD